MSAPFDAVVLLAHGARDARWREPFHALERDLRARVAPSRVQVAFLEMAPPSFAEAVAALHAEGARRFRVVPVFLSGGGHVAKDVAPLVAEAARRHPDAAFTVAGALGEEPEVQGAMRDAIVRLARDA